MKRLFLDDFRNPSVVTTYCLPDLIPMYQDVWDIVRNYDEFVKWIEKYGLPDIVSFDHDLAAVHYDPRSGQEGFVYDEETGLDCAKWLVQYCIDNKLKLPEYYIHSMNPVGWDNIYNYLENYKKHAKLKVEEPVKIKEDEIL